MRAIGFILTSLLVVALAVPAVAAEAPQIISGWSTHNDTSPPMREIAKKVASFPGMDREVKLQERPDRKVRPDIDRGPDPGRQTTFRPDPTAGPTPGPSFSVVGLDEADNRSVVGFSVVPPDPTGDVGANDYVQWVNLVWGVFDKNTGTMTAGPFAGDSFWDGFGGNCDFNNDGDPMVLYDDTADRWVVAQFAIASGTQCVAVSTTSDPLGTYNRYSFVWTPGGNNDYPKMGVWPAAGGQSAYTFTTRDFTGFAGFNLGSGVMERDAMLAGNPAQFFKFVHPCTTSDCVEGLLPPHVDGQAPPSGTCPTYFAASDGQFDDDGPNNNIDGYRNYTGCVNWGAGTWNFSENPLAPGTAFDRADGNGFSGCVDTPGENLDCLSIFTMHRAQYRWQDNYASVMLNHTVDAGGNQSAVRWAELRSGDGQTGWWKHQDSTFDPDNNERWMGSIAMNGRGDVMLGYSVTSNSLNPSPRVNSRMAQDALNTLPGGEVSCHAASGSQTGSAGRWGDYSDMTIDPDDDCTFYYTSEYYQTTTSFDFKTRICSFEFGCGDATGNISLDSITGNAGGNITWNYSGATASGGVDVTCHIADGVRPGQTINVGTSTASGAGTGSFTRFIPGQASGRRIECQVRDNTTGDYSDVVSKTL